MNKTITLKTDTRIYFYIWEVCVIILYIFLAITSYILCLEVIFLKKECLITTFLVRKKSFTYLKKITALEDLTLKGEPNL